MTAGFFRYLFERLFRAAITIVGIVTIVFLLVRAIPGDPVDAILGEQAAPEDRAALRELLLLDRPLTEQYAGFWAHVTDGTLGFSFRQPDQSVFDMISRVLPHTIALALAGLAVAWFLAVPLGTLAASKKGTWWDKIASTIAVVGIAIPNIWLGPILILVFAVNLRWLPLPGDDHAGLAGLILPAFTIGTALAAILTRQTRASMVEILSQQYIVAARARGLSELRVLSKHALRNALLPVLTVGAAQLGALLSGAVITEKNLRAPRHRHALSRRVFCA